MLLSMEEENDTMLKAVPKDKDIDNPPHRSDIIQPKDAAVSNTMVPIKHDVETLQKMTIITIRALVATAKLSTNGSKAVLIERYLARKQDETMEEEDNHLIDALMKWTAPAQREYLKLMNKPTSGNKEALVNRILCCMPIDKAMEIVRDYRESLVQSGKMDIDLDTTDKEIRAKAATLLVNKRLERKRKSDTVGGHQGDEDDSSSTKKGAYTSTKIAPPQERIWKYR